MSIKSKTDKALITCSTFLLWRKTYGTMLCTMLCTSKNQDKALTNQILDLLYINWNSLCILCQGPGVIVESIAACFGLVHKKAAGKYTFDLKLGSLKIVDDKEIDAFMSSYHATRASSKVNLNCLMFYNIEITTCTCGQLFLQFLLQLQLFRHFIVWWYNNVLC